MPDADTDTNAGAGAGAGVGAGTCANQRIRSRVGLRECEGLKRPLWRLLCVWQLSVPGVVRLTTVDGVVVAICGGVGVGNGGGGGAAALTKPISVSECTGMSSSTAVGVCSEMGNSFGMGMSMTSISNHTHTCGLFVFSRFPPQNNFLYACCCGWGVLLGPLRF